MQQHNFVQGSPEWHAHRARSKNASDAPAMLGCSPYQTRQQLLHAMHTGLRPEVSPEQQRIFDDGHAIEAAQRAAAEVFIGDELFPIVGSLEVGGLLLSASFDGITGGGETVYECKSLNADLRAAFADMQTIAPQLRERGSGKCLPKHYRVQMEQQLAVSGAERVLFIAASKDGSEMRRCWYYPDPALRAEILAGWAQFERDLETYQPAPAAQKVVAEPVQALPAVAVRVEGQLAITDNFKAFEVALRDFLEHRLIRAPKTDQDFADLDVQIKAMKGAEAALESAEAQMLAQIQSVDQAKKTKDMLHKLVRDNRLMAEKLLASEKERRKGEIVAGGIGALKAHIDGLNQRLGKPYMPQVPADFGGAVKGLKTIASMEDRVATELARAKISANEIADKIDANLKSLRELAIDYASLFADTSTLVLKAPDDCRTLIEARIAAHKAEQERRAQELAERERARIRAEEEAKARAQAAREQQEKEAVERRQRAEEAARAQQQRQQQSAHDRINDEGAQRLHEALSAAAPAPGPAVIPMPTRAPAALAGPPTLRLGELQKRIAPLSIDAAGLATLGFPFVKQEGAAKLWHEHQFPAIVDAAIAQLARAKLKQLEAA